MNPPPLPRPNPVGRFFVGLWDVMNFTRRLILNLLFFGLLFLVLILFIAALGKGSGVQPLQERTTLVIAPEGRLVEQFTADPVTRALARALGDRSAEEIQLRDLLRAIEAASAIPPISSQAISKPGMSVSISITEPMTKAMIPPIPSTPKVGVSVSAMISASPSKVRARPP